MAHRYGFCPLLDEIEKSKEKFGYEDWDEYDFTKAYAIYSKATLSDCPNEILIIIPYDIGLLNDILNKIGSKIYYQTIITN